MSKITEVPGDATWQRKWDVESADSGRVYRVSLHNAGHFGCSCPHWINRLRKSHGQCKHIKALLAYNPGLVTSGKAPMPAPPQSAPAPTPAPTPAQPSVPDEEEIVWF